MTVMSSSLTSAPSIVRPSSIVRQITSATGQAEQVDFMVSLGCENGSLNSSIFYPRLTYFPTSPRRENAPLRTLNTEEPDNADALVRAENLTKVFASRGGDVTAVNDVSFALDPGRTLGIVG